MKKFNWNNAHIYFFYLFLLSIPLQARKVFLTQYSFYSGNFTEYTTFFIYISDILLILTLVFWLVFNRGLDKYFKIRNLKDTFKLNSTSLLLFIFIFWLILNTVINNAYTEISVFYILKFIELELLFIYLYFNLRNKKRLVTALFVISLAGFFQGLIAIYQFIYQCPLFKNPLLHRLTGESTVYPQFIGIAKITVDNEKLIRSYGTFPHPNVLGGFLIVSILVSVYLILKHKSYILSRLNLKYNNINYNKSQAVSLLLSLFWILFIFTQITALLFTFSRTAWVGFLISLFLIGIFYIYHFKIVSRETIKTVYYNFIKTIQKTLFIKTYLIPVSAGMTRDDGILNKLKHKLSNKLNKNKIVSRETIYSDQSKIINRHTTLRISLLLVLNSIKNNITKQKELFIVFLLTIILIINYFPYINNRINKEILVNNNLSSDYLPSNYALDDRIFYNIVSRETISENFIFGSGLGTSIFQIDSYLIKNNIHQKLKPWQYQPTHNIYLLIISEIGIVGFAIFVLFIAKIMVLSFKIIKKTSNKHSFLNNDSNSSSIVSRETILNELNKKSSKELNYYLIAIFVALLFIGLFDHYFWTLQQGKLIFWFVLGLMLVNSRSSRNRL